MKSVQIFMVVIMCVGIAGISESASALSQPNIECKQASICVHPGDFVTYSTEFGSVSSTETYTFGNYIGTDKVSFSITSITNGTKTLTNDILDLNTGFYNETGDSIGFPIIVVYPTPILIDKNVPGYSEKTQDFNDIKRILVTAANKTDATSAEIAYDKETGVLVYLHLTSHSPTDQTSPDSDLMVSTKYDLINTNMFATSETQPQSQIPSWVKNNAKWWSEGQVGDSEFVQGIQYLIKQGIVKIPETQSDSSLSQQIPTWVKTNAGWWANGQISDNDFVKGIEYLVSSGVIQV